MNMSNCVSSVGLVLDIIGAVLIWRFGLPETLNRDGTDQVVVESRDPKQKARVACYNLLSNVGIGLLVLGFALQLFSNFL